jgi:hypothetical protein
LEEVFVDSGLFGYDDSQPYRQYVRSPAAHSTVYVRDGTPAASSVAQAGTGLTDFQLGAEVDYARGINSAFQDVRLARTVAFIKPDLLLLCDQAHSASPQTLAQNFNLHEDLRIENCDRRTATLKTPGGKMIRLRQFAATDDVHGYTGSTEPLRGFRSLKFGAVTPNPQIEFLRTGSAVEFITVIELGSQAEVRLIQRNSNAIELTRADGRSVRVPAPALAGLASEKVWRQ